MRRRNITSAYLLYITPKDNSYVDLGLPSGVQWATCNVGADNPWEFGINYGSSYLGTDTYVGEAQPYPTDATIQAIVGSNFRLPSPEEIEELCEYCSCQTYILNGVGGHLFTGPNGKSIFLPANQIPDIYSGRYWSNVKTHRLRTDLQYYGLSLLQSTPISGHYAVRPVC